MFTDSAKMEHKKKPKEVIHFENMNDLEIKLDPTPDEIEAVKQEAPAVEAKREGNVGGSLKLKLKVVKSAGDEMVVQVAKPDDVNPSKSVGSIDDLIKKSDNEESNGEDDELIRDLKNSYQDDDFGRD